MRQLTRLDKLIKTLNVNQRNLEKMRRQSLSPGQTDSQVVASWKLGSTCDSVWPGLACTCVDLRWLAIRLSWTRSNLHASQCKLFTVWPPNPSLLASSTCLYLRLLESPFDQGFRDIIFSSDWNEKIKCVCIARVLDGLCNHWISIFFYYWRVLK